MKVRTKDKATADRCKQALHKQELVHELITTDNGPTMFTGYIQSVEEDTQAKPKCWAITILPEK